MDIHLVVPVGVEERRKELLDLCLGQLLCRAPSEIERTVRSAVLEVVVDLAQQNRREIERDVHLVFGSKGSHRVVVADCVQADPRIPVAPASVRSRRIAVEGLVLVPQPRDIERGPHSEAHWRGLNRSLRGRPFDCVTHTIALAERWEARQPVAIPIGVALPLGNRVALRRVSA